MLRDRYYQPWGYFGLSVTILRAGINCAFCLAERPERSRGRGPGVVEGCAAGMTESRILRLHSANAAPFRSGCSQHEQREKRNSHPIAVYVVIRAESLCRFSKEFLRPGRPAPCYDSGVVRQPAVGCAHQTTPPFPRIRQSMDSRGRGGSRAAGCCARNAACAIGELFSAESEDGEPVDLVLHKYPGARIQGHSIL